MKFYDINPSLKLEKRKDRFFLSWVVPSRGVLVEREATSCDLIALKIVAEDADVREVSLREGVEPALLYDVLRKAEVDGIIVKKPTSIVRTGAAFDDAWFPYDEFRKVELFTLQWHITQRCDFGCKHCYDRSFRKEPSLKDAIRILDDFYDFCERNCVYGQISFTGGNPFLYPDFLSVYREAIDRGFLVAILGNPVDEYLIDEMLNIRFPLFYQVSLDGLEETNDRIRGHGHYKKTVEFIKVLREKGVATTVMFTLHDENINEVIPLARSLEGMIDMFSFNRLSLAGRGKCLSPVDIKKFYKLLDLYLEESKNLPYLNLKDNMFNRVLWNKGMELVGGCTGYGCGAAFNFLALLPDGEVHACRKFPSHLGNVFESSLHDIYWSSEAEAYRNAPVSCAKCKLCVVCRGCLAVTATYGLDPFKDRDPFCPGPVA